MLRGAGLTVAVAIDRDKGSQNALKWATDNVAEKGSSLILIHVQERAASMASPNLNGEDKEYKKQMEIHSRELFAPFRCFCSRKDIKVEEILLEHTDVAKAITDYLKAYSIDVTVLGAATRNGFMRRFKGPDIPTSVTKMAPDFCTVYVISKGKVSATRSGIPCPSGISGAAPRRHQLTNQASHLSDTQTSFSHGSRIKEENKVQSAPVSFTGNGPEEYNVTLPTQNLGSRVSDHYKAPLGPHNMNHDTAIKSPFDRARNSGSKFPADHSPYESDISFVSSGKPSTGRSSPFYDSLGYALSNSNSNSSDTQNRSFGAHSGSPDLNYTNNFSSSSGFTGISLSSENGDDVEAEMKRLKLELKQTMDMYSSACNEALSAKQKARELHHWKLEEEHRIEEVRLAQEAALALAEREKAKCRAAIETAEASQKIAEREARKRLSVEMKARRESDEKKAALDALSHSNVRYRKYTIEEIETATDYFQESLQIGEGGYGPVYKCYLDHTPVAVKALRPDAAHGRSQFQQEVEVLSCIRHPNMVLLLGACPEYGCLVYEYMANGSLEDRLFRRGNTPVLPWQLRFKIAAEIGTGLLFLHQTKPKPLVHRDLKPANILLDHNFVSKISDVGLARLVPPSVANSVTQYHMTSAAGTFCYIDPEYQQTGMLGIKSDVYSLGIILLQIITAKPPMGLAHHVEGSIEGGTFAQILDPDVSDWPMEETLRFAKLALQCAELRRKDRPDLGKVLLPELNRLRVLAEKYMHNTNFWSSPRSSPTCSQFSISQDKMNSMPTQDNGNE